MKRYFTNLSILVALLICLATFGATTNVNAQTTFFSENFGTPTANTPVGTYTGYQNGSPVTYTSTSTASSDVRATTPSMGYTGASGGGNVFFGIGGGNDKNLIISGINSSNFTTISLSFGLLRADVNNPIAVEVSSDGTAFTPLTITQPTTANSWTLINATGTIPATTNLRIRFSKNSTTQFRVDDVRLVGTTGATTAPAITSANNATFTAGTAGTFTATATGSPAPTFTLNGTIPTGVSITSAGVLTSTTATPAGTSNFNIVASNGTAPDATQSFTLTVNSAQTAPAFTSANNSTFTVGTMASFPVTTSGNPTVTSITSTGALPSGVTFLDNGNGTATLSGTPAAGTAESYPLTFTAANGVAPDASQSFTLTVVDVSAPAQVVISQVYGGGGNAGAAFTNDYVELHNNGTTTATLNNYSIQYAAATNTANFGNITVLPVSITIPAGGYYLVQLASGGAVGATLPTPDFIATGTGNTNASATAGKFALVSSTTPVSSTAATGATVVDFVGYGTANASEGNAPAPAGSNANGIFRLAGGCTDTNNNAADFMAAAAAARNSASPVNICGGAVNPTISLSVSSNAASETNPTAIIVTATASSAVTADTTVTLTPSGTATSGSDYTLASTTITILSGQTTGTTTFTVIDDAVVDADETAILTISAITGSAATVGTPAAQTITITDNEVAPVVTCTNTTVLAPASDATPTALTGANAGDISIYNTSEQQGDTPTTRAAVDAQDDAWRTNASTRVGGSNVSTAWSAPADATGDIAVGNPYTLFTFRGVTVTTSLRNMGTDINASPCMGNPVAATATQPEIADNVGLQGGSPRPASLFNATGAMNSTQPKFYNENIGTETERNALLFTFSTPVNAFGAWFGDVETLTAGQLAVVRLFDVNGDRIGNDILIEPGAGFDGDAETRWIGFVDNSGSASLAPGDPRVKSMLVIVGDDNAGGAGITEHLSFIGATVGTSNVSTAAGVSTSGKVLNAKNRGISRARVSITDTSTGIVRTTFTGVDGKFGFDDLAAGRFYIVSVNSKRYTFDDNQRGIQLFEDNDELIFKSSR